MGFFSRYFSVSHCDGGMFANITSHGVKVQKISQSELQNGLWEILSLNQFEIQIFTMNVLILILNVL